ncbi:MAG: hypothetical protein QW625_00790 [Candidatus Nanoarchaeia archaeon]
MAALKLKKNAIVCVILIIVIIFAASLMLLELQEKNKIQITNFQFNEDEKINEFHVYISKTRDRVIFEGVVEKPTPCNKLYATYEIKNQEIKINIKIQPSTETCIQVIKKQGFQGSFNYLGPLEKISIWQNSNLLYETIIE